MLKDLLKNEFFYCEHIGVTASDEKDIMGFSARDLKGKGLINYLQHEAFPDEDNGIMRTCIVRDNATMEMVGYFSLKAGLISYNEHDVPVIDEETGKKVINNETGEVQVRHVFDTLPGVELANFAVNDAYVRKNPVMKGAGLVIYQRFIYPIIRRVAEAIGIKIIYLFALPYDDLIVRYNKYGFKRLDGEYEDKIHSRLKPKYDDSCIFMYTML